jgi:2-dehydro-3-deoxy-D-gluconate 5-dehydrogenase
VDLGLVGKVAIVTGASRGLGWAAAEALVAEGVRVVATGRSARELDELAARHPGQVVAMPTDMNDMGAVAALPERTIMAFGRLDIVVNNAGIAPAGPFLKQSVEGLEEVMAVNVIAPAVLARAAGETMVAQGSGKIINIASISGIRGKPVLVGYSTSKGALIQFTKALAGEWARYGVQVNAIAPGGFVTEAQAAVLNDPDTLAKRVRKIPAGRMADKAEIGPMVCYLASSVSDFVTGAVLVIDGGETAKI